MPRALKLVVQASALVDRCQFEKARMLIEEALRLDPNNLSAWETYLQMCTTREELENARDRVLNTRELNTPDELGIFAERFYLIRRIEGKMEDL